MARAVAARGHEVEIYTTDWGLEGKVPADGRAVEDGGVAVRYFPVHAPRFWKTSLPMCAALRRNIAGFDVVHLHSLYLFHDWAVPVLCRRAGVPYILRPHGTLDPYIRRRHRRRKALAEVLYQDRALRRAAAIHYTTAEEMRLATPHAHGARGVVVPNGFDLAEFDRMPDGHGFRARYPETAGRRIVLFLGRLHEKKGLDLLIPAFARVLAARPDLHLIVAGPDDGVAAELGRWVAREGIAGRVSAIGMLAGEDKKMALAAAELFVLPSYSENFGLAVLEAMAAGLPVLISDQVNLWREISDASAGIVVACRADAVEAGLARLLDDPDMARRMGRAGAALAREKFAWPLVAAALEALYVSVRASK